ncbi:MAG TPA: polysaccharide biosynthesis/export family protein [Ideonella sp.]|uniref:polysaccharide biosynthesis/export family protein n=1 Tax=Ideonella sp. TaxID=1929293 RepID=UPI002E36D85E|nr:polysaccharide biosynthesis/export family protein [Ideonella sp.]HEX5686739.1 polysaccharide biosynthesis/export family protein [Ideonella sp.]
MSLHPRLTALLCAVVFSACSQLPTTGPSASTIRQTPASEAPAATGVVQVVDINENVVSQLLAGQSRTQFSEAFGDAAASAQSVGPGDVLEVTIWETPPATLFGAVASDLRVAVAAVPTTLPAQMVDREGTISVPFAGRIQAAGMTPRAISASIMQALKGKANQPQVLVRVVQNTSATVTVVGEVATNVRVPLTAGGERLLDALAAAGGVKQPISKVSLQLTRGTRFQTMPLEAIIRDPRQNIPMQPGDVLTALYQPLSFTALGATGRQDEVAFEAQGISLAQAMGRIGGLLDSRSDPRGVFIFRFEPKAALEWPQQPAATTPEGMVPVVYRLDLSDPRSFFAMQSFTMHHRDLVYVSNAPAAELQKFLNMVFSAVYPVVNLVNATK